MLIVFVFAAVLVYAPAVAQDQEPVPIQQARLLLRGLRYVDVPPVQVVSLDSPEIQKAVQKKELSGEIPVAFRLGSGAPCEPSRVDPRIFVSGSSPVYRSAAAGDPVFVRILAAVLMHERVHGSCGEELFAMLVERAVVSQFRKQAPPEEWKQLKRYELILDEKIKKEVKKAVALGTIPLIGGRKATSGSNDQ